MYFILDPARNINSMFPNVSQFDKIYRRSFFGESRIRQDYELTVMRTRWISNERAPDLREFGVRTRMSPPGYRQPQAKLQGVIVPSAFVQVADTRAVVVIVNDILIADWRRVPLDRVLLRRLAYGIVQVGFEQDSVLRS